MVDVVKEIKIELTVASDEMLSRVIETIEKYNKTETTGDGEIFVSAVEKVAPFRRSETKRNDAL